MNDSLLNTVESLRSSVRILRKKFLDLKMEMEAVSLDFDKLLDKYDRISLEAVEYRDKLDKRYERRCRLAEVEVRSKTIREIKNNSLGSNGDSQDVDSTDTYIAATVSILETFINIVSGGNDGFKMMCQSVVFPCIYEKLLSDEVLDYAIYKVPDIGAELANLGREYARSVIDRAPYQLSSEKMWDQFSGEVAEWWKDSMLPAIYGDRTPDLSAEPYDLKTINDWRHQVGSRVSMFPEVHDAFCHLRSYKYEIDHLIGVDALLEAFPDGVNFY